MRRKLVQHGPSSLVISLPAKWVQRNRLQKGEEVEVDVKDHSLVIAAGPGAALSIREDVSALPVFLVTRFLARSYQKGYDELFLTHNSVELLRAIQEKVTELMGYEVLGQDERTCHIKVIASKFELDFDAALRKALQLTKHMLDIAVEAYKTGDQEALANLYLRDFEVNRYCYYCLRWMSKNGLPDPSAAHQSHVLYYLVEILEDYGDCLKALGKQLAGAKRNDSILEILEMIQQQTEISFDYFYRPTAEKATRAYHLQQQMLGKLADLAGKKLRKEEILAIPLLKEAAGIMYHFTTMRLDFLSAETDPAGRT